MPPPNTAGISDSAAFEWLPSATGCQFNVVQDRLGYWHVRSALSISTHYTKTGAVDYARERAQSTFSAKVAIHNEDGSIDYLEHGFGQPDLLYPEFLASSSGSTFPKVEASISDMLARGAQALIKKKNGDTTALVPVRVDGTGKSGRVTISGKKKLLIIDDNVDVLEMFGTFLAAVGYEVALARTLDDALEVARANRPDAVIMDWRAPGTSRERFLVDLRSASAPSCVMIGGDVKSVMQAERQGVQYFLPKPVDTELLEHILCSCFNVRARA